MTRNFVAAVLIAVLSPLGAAWAVEPSNPAPGPAVAVPNPPADKGARIDALGQKLQAFLLDAKKQLGSLEPWQNKLFDDEVLSEYKRFIRGYRNSPTGIEAEADMDAIRNYLRFYGPKTLKRESPTIVVYLKAQADCPKCSDATPEIQKLVSDRLDHRGLVILWLTPKDLSNANLSGRELDEAIGNLAAQRRAVGALVVQWQLAPVDDDDAHEGETHYLIHSYLSIRDVAEYEEQLDLLDTGSFERSEAKLLTDAFTDVGDKMQRLEINHSELNRDEILVEVFGFGGFHQYGELRASIQETLKNGATVQEQRIGRGLAVFSVFTDAPVQRVQAQLGTIHPEDMAVNSITVDGQKIRIAVTPSIGRRGAE